MAFSWLNLANDTSTRFLKNYPRSPNSGLISIIPTLTMIKVGQLIWPWMKLWQDNENAHCVSGPHWLAHTVQS
ncbi:hypothetical protein BJI67_00015 [Acidihalobacter aeolianus]|uniref:Uncharacterized protein n=1 Tax=Acidihalobacter aeolianus TaxID=2792603 RepID=A0A1D8K3Y1_9GAMM|nr:hypothetical protein BJI67_00015 [Acidihalobacter aeolianus]